MFSYQTRIILIHFLISQIIHTYQKQQLRRQQSSHSAEKSARPDPNSTDHGRKDLARVDEDATEAAHDGGFTDQGEADHQSVSVNQVS